MMKKKFSLLTLFIFITIICFGLALYQYIKTPKVYRNQTGYQLISLVEVYGFHIAYKDDTPSAWLGYNENSSLLLKQRIFIFGRNLTQVEIFTKFGDYRFIVEDNKLVPVNKLNEDSWTEEENIGYSDE
jgi:hypothetical protein